MSYMRNIRRLQISDCNVDGECWSMLAVLPSLEDLEFYKCLVHTGPEKCLKLKVSRLLVVDCGNGHHQIILSIDMGCLRGLAMDLRAIEEGDWLRQSDITELYLYSNFQHHLFAYYIPRLNVALAKAPRSLQTLGFKVDELTACTMAADIIESMLEDPVWKEFSSLCSFTVQLNRMLLGRDDTGFDLSVNDNLSKMKRIIHDKLGPLSALHNLNYIGYFWNAFRLVDGEWFEGDL